MALTLARFLVRFPEFKDADPDLVQAKLDEAANRIDATVWKTHADDGQGYQAAHLLATSPYGNASKLISDAASVYKATLDALRMAAVFGLRNT